MRKTLLLLFVSSVFSLNSSIDEKVIIAGVCKNIEKAVPNLISSIERLGQEFKDYSVIIYENNSFDRTVELLSAWKKENPKVLFMTETLPWHRLKIDSPTRKVYRSEAIARARNIVLKVILQPKYDDYKYVIMADLDFTQPWDIEHIIETIEHPACDFDAVFAWGNYDLFAFRDYEFPVGYELIGDAYFFKMDDIRLRLHLTSSDPWRKVYSAFGGLGIYKRDSIKGCRYSGVVTRDLEQFMMPILKDLKYRPDTVFYDYYLSLLKTAPIIDLYTDYLHHRKSYPTLIGMRLHNYWGMGKIVWFSAHDNMTLPTTCEHIPFHASMILKGHDKLFINPKIYVVP